MKPKGSGSVALRDKFERIKRARAYQPVRTDLLHLTPSPCGGGEDEVEERANHARRIPARAALRFGGGMEWSGVEER